MDLVNLRYEEYAEDNKYPVIRMGTPLEDAERWDLTINALFYNIQTGKIEDLTGKGIEDLKNGIIWTPLDPYKTFKDDPLRILRTIWFATWFGFKISEEILNVLKEKPDLKTCLWDKITIEWIGMEMDLMM